MRDDERGSYLICINGKEALIAKQFNSIWFIAYGETKKKGTADKGDKGGFATAADAFTKISNNIFDALDEAGM